MTNLRKALLAVAAAITLSPVYAQTPTVEEKPYIEVTGVAEQEVIPDEIYIAIEIRERKDKTSVEEQEEKLKVVIKDLGLNLSDLHLADAITDYMKVRLKSGTMRMGKSYTLKVKDAMTAGKLFYRLDKDDIAEAHIERLDYSGMDSLRKAMRLAAIKAAKDKATYLLEAIGQEPGKPLVIREDEQLPYPNPLRQYATNVSYESDSKWKQEVAFEKMKVRSSIYIKYGVR